MDSTLATKLNELGLEALNFAEMSAKQVFEFINNQAPEVLRQWVLKKFGY